MKKNQNDKLKKFIDGAVEKDVEQIFVKVHKFAKTKSGDMTPWQDFELQEIKKQLSLAIFNQTIQNLE